MRYNGDLVRFEDAKPLFYESQMNDGMQYGKQPDSGNKAYDPYSEPIPPQYNPFDHSNDFLQNDFSL